MNQAAHDAIAHYLARGLGKGAAVGMVAVFMAESELKPGSQGAQSTETPGALNPSGAYGIMSLNGTRQQKLVAFATKKGVKYDTVNAQLDFALNEAANDYPKTWAVINNPEATYAEVIDVMVRDYERPKDPDAEIARAVKYAEEFATYNIDVTPAVSAPVPPPQVAAPAPALPAFEPLAPEPMPPPPPAPAPALDQKKADPPAPRPVVASYKSLVITINAVLTIPL